MPTKTEPPSHETVLDVAAEQIARVYALAFLSIASKSDDADSLVEQLESLLTDVLDKFPKFEETLSTSLVSHEHKEGILDRVLGGRMADEGLNFLKVLSSHDRLDLLRPVVRILRKLHDKSKGLQEVEVRVASKLDASLQEEIANTLRTKLAIEPVLQVVVDPSILAGFVIKVGDRVYDGSISNRFEIARKAMIRNAVEMIESQSAT